MSKIAMNLVRFTYLVQLKHFEQLDFKNFTMNPNLLIRLDILYGQWYKLTGKRLKISPVNGAIGRKGKKKSRHCYETYGSVEAIDVFPEIETLAETNQFYNLAKELDFTGIGVYPEARPSTMFHLDVRDETFTSWGAKRSANPDETWDYVGISETLKGE